MIKVKKARNNIEKIRKLRGMTRPQLAKELGVTDITIYRKERADRKLGDEEVERYAQALGCKPSDLFEDIENLNIEVYQEKQKTLEERITELEMMMDEVLFQLGMKRGKIKQTIKPDA